MMSCLGLCRQMFCAMNNVYRQKALHAIRVINILRLQNDTDVSQFVVNNQNIVYISLKMLCMSLKVTITML